jgi:hypothetical protein
MDSNKQRSLYELGQSFGLAPPSHGYTISERSPEVVTAPGIYFPAQKGEVLSPEHYLQKKQAGFDPEGKDYDYESAKQFGLKPDETGHWPSRVPETGLLLKGKGHETWPLTVEGEEKAGYQIYKGKDGRYYSTPMISRANEGPVKPVKYGSANLFDKLEESAGITPPKAEAAVPIEKSGFVAPPYTGPRPWKGTLIPRLNEGPVFSDTLTVSQNQDPVARPESLTSYAPSSFDQVRYDAEVARAAQPAESQSASAVDPYQNFRDRQQLESSFSTGAEKNALTNKLASQGPGAWGNPMMSASTILSQRARQIEQQRKSAIPPLPAPSVSSTGSLSSFAPGAQPISSYNPATSDGSQSIPNYDPSKSPGIKLLSRQNEGKVAPSVSDNGDILKMATKSLSDIIKATLPKDEKKKEIPIISRWGEGTVVPSTLDEEELKRLRQKEEAQAVPVQPDANLVTKAQEESVQPTSLASNAPSAEPSPFGDRGTFVDTPSSPLNPITYQPPASAQDRTALQGIPTTAISELPKTSGTLQVEGGPKIDVPEEYTPGKQLIPGSTGTLTSVGPSGISGNPMTEEMASAYQALTKPAPTAQDLVKEHLNKWSEPGYAEKSLASAREKNPNVLATSSPLERTYYDAHPDEKLKDEATQRAKDFLEPYQKAFDDAQRIATNMSQGFGLGLSHHGEKVKSAQNSLAAAGTALAHAQEQAGKMFDTEVNAHVKEITAGAKGTKYTPFGYGQMIDQNGNIVQVPTKPDSSREKAPGAPRPRTDKGWTLTSDPKTGLTMATNMQGIAEAYDPAKHGMQETVGVITDERAEEYAHDIADGRLMPSQLRQVIQAYGAAGSQSKDKIFSHLKVIAPKYNFKVNDAVYTSNTGALKNLTNIFATAKVAMGTAIEHGERIKKLTETLGANLPLVINRWINAGRKQILGDKAVNDLDTALNAYATEFTRYLTTMTAGGVVAQREIEHARNVLNSAMTPEMLISAVDEIQGLMDDKRSVFQHEINSLKTELGLPVDKFDEELKREDKRPPLASLQGKQEGAIAQAKKGDVKPSVEPDKELYFNGSKWVVRKKA